MAAIQQRQAAHRSRSRVWDFPLLMVVVLFVAAISFDLFVHVDDSQSLEQAVTTFVEDPNAVNVDATGCTLESPDDLDRAAFRMLCTLEAAVGRGSAATTIAVLDDAVCVETAARSITGLLQPLLGGRTHRVGMVLETMPPATATEGGFRADPAEWCPAEAIAATP